VSVTVGVPLLSLASALPAQASSFKFTAAARRTVKMIDGAGLRVVDPVAGVYSVLRGVPVADFTTPTRYVWHSAGPWDAASVLPSDHTTTPAGANHVPEDAP
jgi:hypothetical protein